MAAWVGEQPLPVAESGRFSVPLPLRGRENRRRVRVRLATGALVLIRVGVHRVPRPRGGDLLLPGPAESLLTVHLPDHPVPPEALPVWVQAPPGTKVGRAVVGEGGVATVRVDPRRPLRVVHPREGRLEIPLGLTVDPHAGDALRLGADLRAGYAAGGYAEGGVWGIGRLALLGGTLHAGLALGDRDLARWLAGGPFAAPEKVGRRGNVERYGGAAPADSTTREEDAPPLPLWLTWKGPAGRVGLTGGRVVFEGDDVGRFERAVVGPTAALRLPVGPVIARLEGGADLALAGPAVARPVGIPTVATLPVSGSRVLWLPHSHLVQGTLRLRLETVDPFTGAVVDSRPLVSKIDYDTDSESGRVLLAAPPPSAGAIPAAHLSTSGLGVQQRIVATYLRRAPDGVASGGARLEARLPWLSVEVRHAGASTGYAVSGAELALEPLPWIALEASVAESRGPGAERFESLDGSVTWRAFGGAGTGA
ncbi:MAG: hypothetical protein D6739_03295, partial [Nitrospirae bacterium]